MHVVLNIKEGRLFLERKCSFFLAYDRNMMHLPGRETVGLGKVESSFVSVHDFLKNHIENAVCERMQRVMVQTCHWL